MGEGEYDMEGYRYSEPEGASALERTIHRWVTHYREMLRLGYWTLAVGVDFGAGCDYDDAYAYVDCLDWERMSASLHFNGDLLLCMPDDQVGRVVLHELLHVMLSGMTVSEERVVTDLEYILGGVL